VARDRGAVLWEYRPPRAHPIVYAGLLAFGAVFLTGSLENLVRDRKAALELLYALPFLATLWLYVALLPSPVRIHERGIAPSRPLLLRWRRPFVAWEDAVAVYPVAYDVTGAFVSPFASSDGKVTQTGLGLESADGRVETVRFTPTRFSLTTHRSRGYREAVELVRALYAARGQPMTPAAQAFTAQEREELARRAREPFLPFFAIVLLFAAAAPALWLLAALRVPVAVALPLCLLLPLGTSLRSWVQSRRRTRLLNLLHKEAEWRRGQAVGGAA